MLPAIKGFFMLVLTACPGGGSQISIDPVPYPTLRACKSGYSRPDMPSNPRCTAIVTCVDGRLISRVIATTK